MTESIKSSIRMVPDYPIKGVRFRDITSLLENPKAFRDSITSLTSKCFYGGTNVLVGIESRGFIFSAPLANMLFLPLVVARKPNKLPNEVFEKDFDLEYGSTTICIQKNSKIKADDNVFVVDDLIATGGTAIATASLIHEEFNVPKKNITVAAVIDLPDLGGSAKIEELGYNVFSVCSFREDEGDPWEKDDCGYE
jgi:adenine phosphoribosyltransferase